MTQFGRTLHDLNIDIRCANSSQAKGRVERANQTLQDQLVKELRLAPGVKQFSVGQLRQNKVLPTPQSVTLVYTLA